MTIPSYGEKTYWEQRYKGFKGKETFEWYGGWNTVKPFLQRIQCKKDVSVLHVGCGNSTLAEDMHENGYRNNQFCVDFVESVVKEMQKRSAEGRPEIKYETMDITDSAFKSHIDASFQLIVDKVSDSPRRLGEGEQRETSLPQEALLATPRPIFPFSTFLDNSEKMRC